MILHDLLRHGGSIRVTDRDDRDHVIVRFLSLTATFFRLVVIRFWRIIRDDTFEELELLLHRVVDACLNSRHGLERALKDRQRGTDRGLSGHIADLHISGPSEATTFLYDGAEEAVQNLAWFFVRQRHDVITHRTRGHVHITPFSRSDRRIVTLDPQTLSFKPTR